MPLFVNAGRIALITRDLAINNNQFNIRMAHVRLVAAVLSSLLRPAFVCYWIINATYKIENPNYIYLN